MCDSSRVLAFPLASESRGPTLLSFLDFAEELVARREASAALPKDPHWNCEEADEDMKPTNGREHFHWGLFGDPVADEVYSERNPYS